ncbi:hypothetical protein EVG20_g6385 [Dentipellis fragilis]|uniref:Uncharacterized protein n=1 Tax=Dentipellis fragilis TaxID=205917 RepID=A0A4Y9YN86_9AGAM|nr:hypothetical protein EVG20_g6385 [Dentipellis fragilis]
MASENGHIQVAAEHVQVDSRVLEKKWVVAGFLRAPLSETVLQKFEDEFAKAREVTDWYAVQIDRTVRPSASPLLYAPDHDYDLCALCLAHFSSSATQYNPYFFVILDARTANDGTAILVYNELLDNPPWEMRITPATTSLFIVNQVIYNMTIEEEGSDLPDDPEEAATWAYDVPSDFSEMHNDVRVPLSKFERIDSDGAAVPEGFVKFKIEDVTTIVPEYPSGPVELLWFGQPPAEEVLLECIEQDRDEAVKVKVVTFQTGPNALAERVRA